MTDVRPSHGQRQGPWQPDPQNLQYGHGYQAPAGFPDQRSAGQYYGQPGPQYGYQPPPPEPKNGLAMPALILGIITLCLSPIPVLNQAGILAGFVGAGLGIAALVIGLRRRVRVVMAAIGLGLSILGLVASFAFTASFVNSINQIAIPSATTGTSGSSGSGSGADTPAAARKVTLKVEGSAKRAMISYSYGGSSGGGQTVTVPWSKAMTATGTSSSFASVSAYTPSGSSGDLKCSIVDEDGTVIAEQSAISQGGQFGSAMVNCFGS